MIQNKNCELCELYKGCKTPCLFSEHLMEERKLVIITECPSKKDDEDGTFMEKGNNSVIRDLYKLTEVDVGNTVHYTTLNKCYTHDVEGIPEAAKLACLPYLTKEVEVIQPTCIMVCGESVFDVLLPDYKYKESIGKVLKSKLYKDIPIIVNFDTKYAAKYMNDNSEFAFKLIQKFADIAVKSYNVATGEEQFDSVEKGTTDVTIMYDIETVKKLVKYCKETKLASYDYETTGLSYKKNKATTLAISFQCGSAYVLPMYHFARKFTDEEQKELYEYICLEEITKESANRLIDILGKKADISEDVFSIIEYVSGYMLPFYSKDKVEIELPTEVRERLDGIIPKEEWTLQFIKDALQLIDEGIFADESINKVAHNAKFDNHWNLELGVETFRGRFDCTLLKHYAINNNRSHALKTIVEEYYPQYAGYENIVSEYAWDAIPLKTQALYNAMDADLTGRLNIILEAELLERPESYNYYRNVLIPVMKSLTEIEHRGMFIDRVLLEKSIKDTETIIEQVLENLKKYPDVLRFEEYKREQTKDKEIEIRREKIKTTKKRLQESADKKLTKLDKKIGDVLDALGSEMDEKIKTKLTNKLNGLERQYTDIETADIGNNYTKAWTQQIDEIRIGVHQMYAGVSFNSHVQLGELIFSMEGFGYPMQYDFKKKAKVATTDRKVLKKFKDDTGFITEIIRYKSVKHTLSTYLVGILDRIDDNDMLHTEYKQGITTGRISSSNPNLQNIPPEGRVKDKIASKVSGFIKKVFKVPEGFTMFEGDYKQAELRVMAYYAKEETMLKSFAEGEDLHVKTGCSIKKITQDHYYNVLTKLEQKPIRQNAKAANFGLIFKISEYGYMIMAEDNYGIILSKQEAAKQHKMFFDMYPSILDYHEAVVEEAEDDGFVETLLGYRRYLGDILSEDDFKKAEADRQAINTKIQGTAGQMTLFAIALLKLRLNKRVLIVNTIHDSIFFLIPDDIIEESIFIIKMTMENLPLKQYFNREIDTVKMEIDFKQGKDSWGTLEEI